jgi:hypothetical protein
VRDVHYTISGTNALDGCSWQGSGGYEPSQVLDDVSVNFPHRGLGNLDALLFTDSGFHFPATATCSGQSDEVDVSPSNWGLAVDWFNNGELRRFPNPGLTNVVRSYRSGNTTWTWDLTATDRSRCKAVRTGRTPSNPRITGGLISDAPVDRPPCNQSDASREQRGDERDQQERNHPQAC